MWSWHNRGCVWDKVAAEWAEMRTGFVKEQDARQLKIEDEKRFVTFALQSVKLSTIPRTRTGKKTKEKTGDEVSRILGPQTNPSIIREDGPTVHLCGDSDVAGTWINGQYALGQKYRENDHIQKTLHPC